MPVATLDELLTRFDLAISSSELLTELGEALARHSRTDASPLTSDEVGFLAAHGGPGVAESLAGRDEAEWFAPTLVSVADSAVANMGVAEAALCLGVDRSRISHRIAQGTLWCFRAGRSPRIPRWQFVGDRLLPGLPLIVAAIPDGISPRSLAAFMAASQPDLDGRTPVEYLVDDGDPQVVAGLIEALGQW